MRFTIGPPLSETGSRADGARSWPPSGRGSLEPVVDVVAGVDLLVKVNETAVFGRVGLV